MAPSFKFLTITPVSFSLTEGTNIPAPPDSPPDTPRPPTSGGGPLSSHPATPNGTKGAPSTQQNGTVNGNHQQMLAPAPNSPPSSRKRPSSVRKLLSLRSMRHDKDKDSNNKRMSTSYGPGPLSPVSAGKLSTDSHSLASPQFSSRPGSPYTTLSSSTASLSRKRSSGWFGSGGSITGGSSRRRKSGFFIGRVDEGVVMDEPNGIPEERSGPPPPTLPEFREFKSLDGALDGGSLGAEDLFKDIK